MAYYNIAPSAGASDGTLHPDSAYEQQGPLMNPSGGFRYRGVTQDELVRNQLNSLTNDPNSAYIRNARQSGAAFAASRGLMNSSLAAGNAQGAAINAALPIAQQDAATYAATHKDNMDAENQALLAQLQSNTQLQGASIGASASMYGADKSYQAELARLQAQQAQAEQDRAFQEQMANTQHGWNTDILNTQHGWETDAANQQHQWDVDSQNRQRNDYLWQTLLGSTFSDPNVWRDPTGAMGRAQYYGQNFNTLYQTLFGGGT